MTLSEGLYAAAYLAGLAAFLGMAWRRRLLTSGVFSVAGAALIGGLVAANVGQRLFAGSPGKSVLAGVVGGYLVVYLYKRYLGLVRPTGDLFAVALCVGEAVGRWGCFFGGCCYGEPTEAPWAVLQHDALRHPTQVYLSVAALGIFAVLLGIARTRPPENTLFFVYGLLFCAARFVVEFFRETDALAVGLSTAQWACVAGFVFFAVRLRALRTERQTRAEMTPPVTG